METNFNFKSQICTSREQSERLLALGLKKETADMVWIPEVEFDAEGEPYDTGNYFERPIQGVWDYTLLMGIPAWSLHRLIEMYVERYISCSMNLKDLTYEWIINEIEIHIKEGDFSKM